MYDGVALDGVRLRVLADGRIAVGGQTLAKGYRSPVDPDPFAEPGWFHTDDLGAVDDSGVLTVLGRVDEAISTGGLTVLPQPVEAALCAHPRWLSVRFSGSPTTGWASGWSPRWYPARDAHRRRWTRCGHTSPAP